MIYKIMNFKEWSVMLWFDAAFFSIMWYVVGYMDGGEGEREGRRLEGKVGRREEGESEGECGRRV